MATRSRARGLVAYLDGESVGWCAVEPRTAWGKVDIMEIIHEWYWARGQAGPYSVIASYITAHEKYAYAVIPIFMLARDGVLIGDDPRD